MGEKFRAGFADFVGMEPQKRQKPILKRTVRQPQDKDHNRALDALVIILCLFFATFFVYRFWTDLNQQMVRAGEQPVGTITFKKKAAQRRFIDRVLWNRLQRESPVYNGDVIRTAEISEASVTFSSGSPVINLNENSLIQIFADENGPRIDFTEGDISVESSRGGVALVSGGKTVNVGEGGVISVRTGEGGAFNLAVTAGDARLVNEDGTVEAAQAGSGVFYNPDGTVSTGPRALVYAPKPDLKMIAGENAPMPLVEFLWNSTNYPEDMATRIECAADRNFRRITYKEDFAVTERAELRVPAGTTYWRAYPVLQNGQNYVSNASTGKVSVIHAPPPRLVAPLSGETVVFRNARPSIRYEWSGTDDPLSFRLVIADNPALASPVVTTNVRGKAQVASALGEGTWYWRVEPVFPQDMNGTPAVSGSIIVQHRADTRHDTRAAAHAPRREQHHQCRACRAGYLLLMARRCRGGIVSLHRFTQRRPFVPGHQHACCQQLLYLRGKRYVTPDRFILLGGNTDGCGRDGFTIAKGPHVSGQLLCRRREALPGARHPDPGRGQPYCTDRNAGRIPLAARFRCGPLPFQVVPHKWRERSRPRNGYSGHIRSIVGVCPRYPRQLHMDHPSDRQNEKRRAGMGRKHG
ncbi:MAG: FecR family protein [Spirochaetaceae bacterium]|nr:FecR family protein [Spirochaetaceae bacterium]